MAALDREENGMALPFSADEVFVMAEQIERNGAGFYRRAGENVGDSSSRTLLEQLAAMEDEHERTFAAMRADFAARGGAAGLQPHGEAELYLQAMAKGRVFDVSADPARALTGKETLQEVFRTAIGLEKDSIVFYVGVREMVPAKLGKEKVDAIIQEEMRHIALLDKQLADVGHRP
jgi:rubrerythrin